MTPGSERRRARPVAPRPDPPAPGAIRYLGHAGFVVAHAGLSLLIDPWFHPAFLGSWFPFPDNRELLPEVVAGRPDFLYLSHLHEDHFDERLLDRLDRGVTVVLPRYRSKSLVRRMTALGFAKQVVLGHRESFTPVPGLTLTMFLDTSHKEDSGLLVDLDGYRFLDLNDCNTPLGELPDEIDLLSAQFSGAMWYPNAYAYPGEVQREKTAEVRSDLFDTLVRKVRLTGARSYLPSAGPPVFLDPELARFNDRDETIFPLWEAFAADFAAACPRVRVIEAAPGDDLAAPSGPVAHWRTDAYLSAYRDRREQEWRAYAEPPFEPVTPAELDAYFARLQSWNRRFLGAWRKDVRLTSDGGSWSVRLGRIAGDIVFEDEPVDPAYTIEVPQRALRAIVDGEVGWEEALLSMRLGLARDPDVFDLTLMSLLRYGEHPAQTMQMVRERESAAHGESIERCGVRMQRFCPHAGEDLSHADIEAGVLECPRHHWKWRLDTGECVSGGTVPLRVGPAAAPGPLAAVDRAGPQVPNP
ncbi:MBL fold metallo-hydrolase [Embleya sp. NPDC056575]|uniref:MBL fold metallo-hydrolase n=1 Tax=unclassified Embleya TaxID=2699296 RepID=UPI0036A3A221